MRGRRIVKTTQLIRKKACILICINYMFRPTVAIIRFIIDFKRKSYIWVGVLIKRSLVSTFCLNVWCGYCIQYNNYFLSVTTTNGVCPLGAAHTGICPIVCLTQRFPYFLRRGALSSPLNQRHVCAYLAVFT